MINAVPTMLARAQRQEKAVLIASVGSLELLSAVTASLDSGIVAIRVGKQPVAYVRTLLATAYWMGHHAKGDFGTILDLSHADLELWRRELEGFSEFSHLSLMTADSYDEWPLPVSWSRIDRASGLADASHLFQALLVPNQPGSARPTIKLPLILAAAGMSSAALRRSVKTGVAGVLLDEELDEAFTAGLRTGLRARATADPAVYFAPATKAVADRLVNYLTCLS